ncbi:uncharacterized protein LOC143254124 [Tachypleus tridentatus]|uniref:uncharacterized protein LOC143254124 n=1 Tax=Tachypleus tridentatus TaxID=6853 RepID=UPI003FD17244
MITYLFFSSSVYHGNRYHIHIQLFEDTQITVRINTCSVISVYLSFFKNRKLHKTKSTKTSNIKKTSSFGHQKRFDLYWISLYFQPKPDKFFPEDLFTDMPKLKSLDISINQISVLPEQTFKPVFTSLDRLIVIGLPFTCVCRLSWIIPQWKEKSH